MAKVTTGGGDSGYTSLLGDQRVPKYDARPDTFGVVDEATSSLGLARAHSEDEKVRDIIMTAQRDLYLLMAELATPPENRDKVGFRIAADRVDWLEDVERDLKTEVEIPNAFIIPGDSVVGAALDVARTVIRRAERLTARLEHQGALGETHAVRYLNRLSDMVFILARYVEAKQGGSTRASRR